MEVNNAIEVRNMDKYFKVQYDKANTLKELLVRGGSKKAETHHVLKNINIDIRKGETVCLIGTNGSGKSTLLKLMTKIIYPNKGTIQTQGKIASLLELGAGFHEDFTGRENIYFNASIFGLTRKEIESRIETIIEFSELGDFIDNPIRTYSSGMYMRLAFSIAINVDADILLIDEILAVGDQHFQEKCFAKLEELRDSDRTIVIVSHSLDTVKKLCNRAIWIYKGEFRLDGDPTFVIEQYLKQVSLDHIEEAKATKPVKKERYNGTIFIDTPKPFANIPTSMKELFVGGWKLSDCKDARLVVKFDDQEINNISYINRSDVLMAYENQYGGYVTNEPDTIGFDAYINLDNINSGQHQVLVSLFDENNKVIFEKDIKVNIE